MNSKAISTGGTSPLPAYSAFLQQQAMRSPRRKRLVEGNQHAARRLGVGQQPGVGPHLWRSALADRSFTETLFDIGRLGDKNDSVVVVEVVVDTPSLVDSQGLAV